MKKNRVLQARQCGPGPCSASGAPRATTTVLAPNWLPHAASTKSSLWRWVPQRLTERTRLPPWLRSGLDHIDLVLEQSGEPAGIEARALVGRERAPTMPTARVRRHGPAQLLRETKYLLA